MLVGAGGLGSPAALYLAAAGVGKIGLADGDVVDFTNVRIPQPAVIRVAVDSPGYPGHKINVAPGKSRFFAPSLLSSILPFISPSLNPC